MTQPILTREQVAEHLAVTQTVLRRYESFGLVSAVEEGEIQGYGPAEIRRLVTIVSLQRDLGINMAGVDAVLRLRAQVDLLNERMSDLAEALGLILDSLVPERGDE
jgi:MerR family transcriptional regulator, heat shock protein HspR